MVHLLGTLITEAAKVEVAMIGATALLGDPIAVLDGSPQIGDGPELPVSSGCRCSKQVRRGVGMETAFKVLDLAFGQSGAIATQPLVPEGSAPFLAVGRAPFHEAGAATTGDVHNLFHRVANPVEAYGLKASAAGAILTTGVGHDEFLDLLFTQLKPSSCHEAIMRYLNG